jgi:hypothetical protein
MAITAAWLNAEDDEPAYAASQLRNLTVSLLAGSTRQAGHTRSGVRISSGHDLEATISQDGTQVTVAPGSCVVDGAASTQGAYAVLVDEPVTRDVPAPHATLHRIDAVWVNLRGRIRRRDGQLMSGEVRNILRLPETLWPGAPYPFPVGAQYRSSSVTARIEVRSADGWIWAWIPADAPARWIDLACVRYTARGQ